MTFYLLIKLDNFVLREFLLVLLGLREPFSAKNFKSRGCKSANYIFIQNLSGALDFESENCLFTIINIICALYKSVFLIPNIFSITGDKGWSFSMVQFVEIM
jgi:hypothetical protein